MQSEKRTSTYPILGCFAGIDQDMDVALSNGSGDGGILRLFVTVFGVDSRFSRHPQSDCSAADKPNVTPVIRKGIYPVRERTHDKKGCIRPIDSLAYGQWAKIFIA
jgi:hypothetical protein